VGQLPARAQARRLSVSRHARATDVSILDLGTLGGAFGQAKAVNRLGNVVGTGRDALGRSRAFLWSAGVGMADLAPFRGAHSSANDISDRGEIVGGGDTGSGDLHAYVLAEGMSFDLGTLGGNESEAMAVNRLGQVAGHSRIGGGPIKHAFFVPDPGTIVDLGTLGGATSIAHGVNDRGEVVGGSGRAFLWTERAGMVDLGTLGGRTSCANDVNDDGYIVGVSETAGRDGRGRPVTHAFLRTPDGTMQDLGTLSGEHSSAAAVSEEEGGVLRIAGHSHDTSGRICAVLWEVRLGRESP
jgi:probable HAF family extracellular repeat protein